MTRHRRMHCLGLALAAAAAWATAPGLASADDGRHDRQEWRGDSDHDRNDHGRYERDRDHGRDDHAAKDRKGWKQGRSDPRRPHGPGRAFARSDRDRHDRRYASPPPPYFHRHVQRYDRWPFYCRDHRHGFYRRSQFDDHLVHYHGLPYWQLPQLVAYVGFGWTYGH